MEPDKSVKLASLDAYVREELKIDAATGQSLVERDRHDEMGRLKLEEQRLKIEKLRKENRKEDRNWIAREVVEQREAALVVRIMEEDTHQDKRIAAQLITVCGGDMQKEAKVKALLQTARYDKFRAVYAGGDFSVGFEEEEVE